MTSLGKDDYENCLNVLMCGTENTFEEQEFTQSCVTMKNVFQDFSEIYQSIYHSAKTMMKITKMYWYWVKKYTSKAKIILL